jgi:hypothetical protein
MRRARRGDLASLAGTMNRRPQLRLVAPGATPEEAAAVAAAIEHFMRATAPPRVGGPPAPPRWQTAALHEGVAREPAFPAPWA